MMMKINRLRATVEESRKAEQMAAKVEEQAAILEYVAIMAGVDLPEPEVQGNDAQQQL